jgi:hypothetical protein
MSKINRLFSCNNKNKEVTSKKSDRDHQILKNTQILDSISLQSCRDVEEEFVKECKVLEHHLKNPDFGVGPKTIGTELELALINSYNHLPSMVNLDLCDNINSSAFQPEISKFCIEFNGPVLSTKKQPLNNLAHEMELGLLELNKLANEKFYTLAVPIGIIPTLTTNDLGMDALTPYWRYHSIDKLLRSLRCNHDFILDISGDDPLMLKWYTSVLEGVNSSYQVHLRINPNEFNDYYNAAQLASAFVLSLSGNSPLLFGHRLWEETRIAIFEQTVNNHHIHTGFWQEQNRVSFGRGWIKEGVLGLFKEICELYYPIFPLISEQEKEQARLKSLSKNLGPDLMHIAQHNGSVWPWNRPIYDTADNGHFRIEMRYLPSGPTIYDMTMNTGFMLGLTKAFSNNINNIIMDLPFKYAQFNFYQAAQFGLKAKCIWPGSNNNSIQEVDIVDLLGDMIKIAGDGLAELGATTKEVQNMQQCMQGRLENKMTGSTWQKTIYTKLLDKHKLTPSIALKNMFKSYIDNQQQGLSVVNWSLDI